MEYVIFIEDNFAARSYRTSFFLHEDNGPSSSLPLREGASYIKSFFDYSMYCNSKFSSATTNMLIRWQNTFASVLNKSAGRFPKYIIIVPDDDLITFLNFKEEGVARLLADWLQWLITAFSRLLADWRQKLPLKSTRYEHGPCVYWCHAPTHVNFNREHNDLHKKFNDCLETLLKNSKSEMRIIKFKKHWDFFDREIVKQDKITKKGLHAYWDALDSAFEFNASRHNVFLAKSLYQSAVGKDSHKEENPERAGDVREVENFFLKHNKGSRMALCRALCRYVLVLKSESIL